MKYTEHKLYFYREFKNAFPLLLPSIIRNHAQCVLIFDGRKSISTGGADAENTEHYCFLLLFLLCLDPQYCSASSSRPSIALRYW